MLLFESDSMTVIVTSANLVETDYSMRVNGFWRHTFSLKRTDVPDAARRYMYNQARNDFGEVLVDYLSRVGIPSEWLSLVSCFDMTKAPCCLVSSVPGSFKSERAEYGMLRLARLLAVERCEGGEPVFAQITSIGMLQTG
jgi:hypothetical protein